MIDHVQLAKLIEVHGIEQTLTMISIEDIEDLTLKIIMRTIAHSLESLYIAIGELSNINESKHS